MISDILFISHLILYVLPFFQIRIAEEGGLFLGKRGYPETGDGEIIRMRFFPDLTSHAIMQKIILCSI
jgi:hypothetical protein